MDTPLPTQVLLRWLDERVLVIMRNEREFEGVLRGVDEYTSPSCGD